jgi:hypothetical protein
MLMLSLLACAPTATGTIVLETSGNRTSTEEQWWRFDDQGRPLRLDSRDGDERGEESWTYGAHAHPTAWEWTRAGDGGRTDYTLDADGRLIEMVVGGPSGIVETWTYEGQTTTWQRSRHEVPSLRVETVNDNHRPLTETTWQWGADDWNPPRVETWTWTGDDATTVLEQNGEVIGTGHEARDEGDRLIARGLSTGAQTSYDHAWSWENGLLVEELLQVLVPAEEGEEGEEVGMETHRWLTRDAGLLVGIEGTGFDSEQSWTWTETWEVDVNPPTEARTWRW